MDDPPSNVIVQLPILHEFGHNGSSIGCYSARSPLPIHPLGHLITVGLSPGNRGDSSDYGSTIRGFWEIDSSSVDQYLLRHLQYSVWCCENPESTHRLPFLRWFGWSRPFCCKCTLNRYCIYHGGHFSVPTLEAQIGSGINADLFRPQERGQAIAVYVLAPLVGIAVGPIAGGFLVQYKSWRWCFYVVSIAGGAVQVFGFPFFRETYPPVILQRRCKRSRKSTQNPNLYTEHDRVSLPQLLRTSLIRPFKLLGTQPIVQVWSLYCAYLWGILYLLIATFPNVWTETYGKTVSIGSLNYISLFVGMGMASQVGTRLADRYYKKLCEKNNGQGLPEFRLPVLLIGALMVPVGLLWYGWSARSTIHWIMP